MVTAETILRAILRLFGQLTTDTNPSLSHRIRGLLIIALSVLNFLYEVVNIQNNVALKLHNGRTYVYKIAEAVNVSQYPMKTVTTMVILVTFWWKSPTIVNLMRTVSENRRLDESKMLWKKRETIISNRISGMILVTFTVNLVMMVCYRTLRIRSAEISPGQWPVAAFIPWVEINIMQEHIITFFLRNTTESVKLFCCGYLAVILYKFKTGLAADCRYFLEAPTGMDPLHQVDVQLAWNAREEALTVARLLQKKLGSFLAFILLADVVCLHATFGDFLFLTTYVTYIRNIASILMYFVSVGCLARGLIGLMDKDREAQELVEKLQSGLSHGTAGTTTDGAPRDWKEEGVKVHRGCKGDKIDLLRMLTAMKKHCFGIRKAAPVVPVFEYVTRSRMLNAAALLFTFTCFMLDQYGQNGPDSLEVPIQNSVLHSTTSTVASA
ncbi:hypothetical protein BV898_01402 [Hypsibius exemplaris]|uniref:Gustatory receptor n=1 Tax=Hypsibius exemplaris TaxID=2072580 RepID=A0A1W0XBV6_HYPEX|nr:hypothetical protein BV898_01402 [Hypsibius exemplaris]